MIKILDEFELNFIKFLNDKKYTEKEVKLSILHNYESVSADNVDYEGEIGPNVGFAVYVPEQKTIMLPTKVPDELKDMKEFVIHNLAHEYCHFIQDVTGREFDEEEADWFADVEVNEYLSKGGNQTNAFVIVNDENKYLDSTMDWTTRLIDALLFDDYVQTLEYKNGLTNGKMYRVIPIELILGATKDEDN